jgi:hypothetical protein
MNGYACSKVDVLPDTYGMEAVEIVPFPTSAGTFSLRRSHYLNETGKHPVLLPGNSGVVISFESAAHKYRRT